MISAKHVVTMKIPFPTISDNLAVAPHMYICLEKDGSNKTFVKCQTLKPYHLGKNKKPLYRITEEADIKRNPFKRKTLIDCDKLFLISRIEICRSLLTKRRNDICDALYVSVKDISSHSSIKEHALNSDELTQLNSKLKLLD